MQFGRSLVIVIAAVLVLSACGAPAAPSAVPTAVPPSPPPALTTAPTSAPAATATVSQPTATVPKPTSTVPPTSSAQAKPTASSPGQAKINFNELFPPGAGRDLVLESCMGCHSVAPILVARKTRAEWENLAIDHKEVGSRLTEAEYKQLFEYLIANFDPGKPVPNLPPELLTGFTNY